MNELQQVLIAIAIIVMLGLFFFQRKKASTVKAKESTPPKDVSKTDKVEATKEPVIEMQTIQTGRGDADKALKDLGEPHIPVSNQTQALLGLEEDKVPENQLGLSFGDEFEVIKPLPEEISVAHVAPETTVQPKLTIIKDDSLIYVGDDLDNIEIAEKLPDIVEPGFGIPEEVTLIKKDPKDVETTEHQVFAIIVMGKDGFVMPSLYQALYGVGLTLSEKGIFVKNDSMGNEIIKVANLLEPGLFTEEALTNDAMSTSGVVLILELPSTVKAPAVMHDMIMMARKISQRLNGRLYNMERHLIKESDLEAMRCAAIAYESKAI